MSEVNIEVIMLGASGREYVAIDNAKLEAVAVTTPEPSSLLTFAGLGLCAGIGAWRRKRKNAA